MARSGVRRPSAGGGGIARARRAAGVGGPGGCDRRWDRVDGDAVAEAKFRWYLLAAWLLATFIWTRVNAGVTGGASLAAWIAAEEIANAAVRLIAEKLLEAIVSAGMGAVIGAGTDLFAQILAVVTGHAHGLDWSSLGLAAASGALGGALGSAVTSLSAAAETAAGRAGADAAAAAMSAARLTHSLPGGLVVAGLSGAATQATMNAASGNADVDWTGFFAGSLGAMAGHTVAKSEALGRHPDAAWGGDVELAALGPALDPPADRFGGFGGGAAADWRIRGDKGGMRWESNLNFDDVLGAGVLASHVHAGPQGSAERGVSEVQAQLLSGGEGRGRRKPVPDSGRGFDLSDGHRVEFSAGGDWWVRPAGWGESLEHAGFATAVRTLSTGADGRPRLVVGTPGMSAEGAVDRLRSMWRDIPARKGPQDEVPGRVTLMAPVAVADLPGLRDFVARHRVEVEVPTGQVLAGGRGQLYVSGTGNGMEESTHGQWVVFAPTAATADAHVYAAHASPTGSAALDAAEHRTGPVQTAVLSVDRDAPPSAAGAPLANGPRPEQHADHFTSIPSLGRERSIHPESGAADPTAATTSQAHPSTAPGTATTVPGTAADPLARNAATGSSGHIAAVPAAAPTPADHTIGSTHSVGQHHDPEHATLPAGPDALAASFPTERVRVRLGGTMLNPPAWDEALTNHAAGSPTGLPTGLQERLGAVEASRIPAGILLHTGAAVHDNPAFALAVDTLPPNPDRLTVVVADTPAARALATLKTELPPQARDFHLVAPGHTPSGQDIHTTLVPSAARAGRWPALPQRATGPVVFVTLEGPHALDHTLEGLRQGRHSALHAARVTFETSNGSIATSTRSIRFAGLARDRGLDWEEISRLPQTFARARTLDPRATWSMDRLLAYRDLERAVGGQSDSGRPFPWNVRDHATRLMEDPKHGLTRLLDLASSRDARTLFSSYTSLRALTPDTAPTPERLLAFHDLDSILTEVPGHLEGFEARAADILEPSGSMTRWLEAVEILPPAERPTVLLDLAYGGQLTDQVRARTGRETITLANVRAYASEVLTRPQAPGVVRSLAEARELYQEIHGEAGIGPAGEARGLDRLVHPIEQERLRDLVHLADTARAQGITTEHRRITLDALADLARQAHPGPWIEAANGTHGQVRTLLDTLGLAHRLGFPNPDLEGLRIASTTARLVRELDGPLWPLPTRKIGPDQVHRLALEVTGRGSAQHLLETLAKAHRVHPFPNLDTARATATRLHTAGPTEPADALPEGGERDMDGLD
ncbi:hypothetical protein [Kitasatospora sp. NPDC059571]|uniref:hypothetical protein n=1 Tax=Kitasatospora sp. NPDC059571 TaxID=3346871 RepID=UPI0036C2D5EC